MSAILSVEHVGVRFGGLVAISDLHFDVHEGEIISLIGPNGAGKTTAFNDEPVSGMNASETRVFVRLIRQIRERGITVLLVEHDMPMVMEVSDRIVVLNYGRLIAEGPPDRIRSDPAVIESYLGQGSAARRAAAEAKEATREAAREAAHA